MRILLIEPFYAGSHKQFADQLIEYSQHTIELLPMPGRHWKWRMYGSGVTMAEAYLKLNKTYDVILVTDMLDITTFLAVVGRQLPSFTKIVAYFHENQWAYPWMGTEEKHLKNQDVHYGMMNYQGAIVCDKVLFNSSHNMESFIEGVTDVMSKMPDHRHDLIKLRLKCQVMHLGLELNKLEVDSLGTEEKNVTKPPLVLWNHRWEHDKNPELFFNTLRTLQNEGLKFRLAIVGEHYKKYPKIFDDAKKWFEKELIAFGFVTKETYIDLLRNADVLPVTSYHDFFGISVMEGIYMGATALLPQGLAYVELYKPDENPELFYQTETELLDKLKNLILRDGGKKDYRYLTEKYDWETRIMEYDQFFQEMMKEGTEHE